MYFNKWLTEQLEQLPITRKDLSRLSGVSYSTMNGSKKFDPRISNLVLICEVLTEIKMLRQYPEYKYLDLPEWRKESLRQKRVALLDSTIISAIASCGFEYSFAINRLQEREK
tara:strand:- start:212 stop:550 length:339 start_codon:yes stop_codon:yes gene_type:complete